MKNTENGSTNRIGGRARILIAVGLASAAMAIPTATAMSALHADRGFHSHGWGQPDSSRLALGVVVPNSVRIA